MVTVRWGIIILHTGECVIRRLINSNNFVISAASAEVCTLLSVILVNSCAGHIEHVSCSFLELLELLAFVFGQIHVVPSPLFSKP